MGDLAANRLIVALDVPSLTDAHHLLDQLASVVTWFKVGLELFNAGGPAVIEAVKQRGAKVFYDSKFHDIPSTIAGAAAQAARMGVDMFNLHASGGSEMMRSALQAASAAAGTRPRVIAVTVLTSLDQAALDEQLGIKRPMVEQVVHLAQLAQQAGLDGVVASPQEIAAIKQSCGKSFLVIAPGVRPEWAAAGDQRRVMTPREAVTAGADYLVVGRPIIKADDPADAARRVIEEMNT